MGFVCSKRESIHEHKQPIPAYLSSSTFLAHSYWREAISHRNQENGTKKQEKKTIDGFSFEK